MMILYKKLNALLGFQDTDRGGQRNIPYRCLSIPPPEKGGLRYVIEETSRKSPNRGDPGAWGLHEAAAMSTGGLRLCTESLGSESCDAEAADLEIAARSPRKARTSRWMNERPAKKKFPPPLPWLSESSGRRSCFMKGERKDGRFKLTEVTIERPEVLRASRQNGRLRLRLVDDADDSVEEDEGEKILEEVEKVLTVRCQDAVSCNGNMPMWWNHRFVTTA